MQIEQTIQRNNEIKRIKYFYLALFFLRLFLSIALILLGFCIFIAVFKNTLNFKNNEIIFNFLTLLIWAICFCFFVIKIRKKPNDEAIYKEFENANKLDELAPLSNFDNININSSNELWNLHKAQIISSKIPKIKFYKLFTIFDKIKIGLFFILIFTVFFSPKLSFQPLLLNFSQIQISQNIEIYAISPKDLGGEKIILNNYEKNIIPINSEIFINIISDNEKVDLKYLAKKINFNNAIDGKKQAQFIFKKNGEIKIKIGNKKTKYKVQALYDAPPKLKGKIKINSVGNDIIALEFNMIEDIGLKSAYLKIKGNINTNGTSKNIEEFIEIDIKNIKNNGLTNVLIETGHSALSGNRIKAQLILNDNAQNQTKSEYIWFNLQKPQFNSDIAQALYELRLLLVQETNQYSAHSIFNQTFFFENLSQEFKFQNIEPIDFAPKSIKNVFDVLKIYIDNSQKLGIDDLNRLGLIYAFSIINSAHSTHEAQKSGDILWEIIKRISQSEKDTKSKINDAIEDLKSAINNNADEAQIEQLKQNLREAIKEHINNLRNQSHESGDMEVEDNNSINGQDLSKMIDEIKPQNKNNEIEKLDELNNLLQNLKLENQGENTPNNAQNLDQLIDELQNNYDKTQNSAKENIKNLEKETRDLANKLKGFEGNKNTENAINELNKAADALKNGDKELAQESQKAAIDALLDNFEKNNEQQNQDPLGRQISKPPNNDKNNNIPMQIDEKKSREILLYLRQKLEDGTISEEERKYYEYLIQK